MTRHLGAALAVLLFFALLGQAPSAAHAAAPPTHAATGATSDFPPNPPSKTGYTLDFQEEFDGTSLDTNKWLPYYLPHCTSNRENAKARYTVADGVLTQRLDADTPAWNPAYDGTVKISSIQTYNKDWWHRFNSSMPNDHHEPDFNGYTTKYGYFEVRAKLANVGGGGHQALWLVGTDDTTSASANPEIDFIETFFSKPDTWRIAAYGWGEFRPAQRRLAQDLDVDYVRVFKKNGGYPEPYVRIKNHQTGQYLHTEAATGKVQYGNAPAAALSSQWTRETTSDGYVRYKNRATGQYMHIEDLTGSIQYGTVPATYWSGQWKEEAVSGYTRIKNRWQGSYIHTENATGHAQYGTVPTTYWTSQWTFEPAA
ncbi:RICIN domain-containing protein [Nonomuraea dietziae]|uniref:RICIN domain-containing protein n=1 Tax=Nonomuraea dietziae TaxID=65515 RepID=UPI0033D7CBFA